MSFLFFHQYWHVHVDKETYGSFHFTSLLYLTDYGIDFKGGSFVFVDNHDKLNRHDIPKYPKELISRHIVSPTV